MLISGAIVVYNEGRCLRRALESLQRVCNEIVLVDSFSTDNTLDIARQYNCNIINHEFDNHRDQKNRAIEACKNPWVLLLDADEYLNNALANNLNNGLLEQLDANGIDALGIPRFNTLDGQGPNGWPDHQTRIFRNYVRHFGHPFHHQTTGNAKKPAAVLDDKYGYIIHDKTLARQKRQNRMYYTMRPADFKGADGSTGNIDGIEGIIPDPNMPPDRMNMNVYQEYLLPNKDKIFEE